MILMYGSRGYDIVFLGVDGALASPGNGYEWMLDELLLEVHDVATGITRQPKRTTNGQVTCLSQLYAS